MPNRPVLKPIAYGVVLVLAAIGLFFVIVPVLYGVIFPPDYGDSALKPPAIAPVSAEPALEPEPPVDVEPPSLKIEGSTALDDAVRAYGYPPTPLVYRGDMTIGIRVDPAATHTIVDRILFTEHPEAFIGHFDRSFLVPGTIIDCMPFVRADLGGAVGTLNDLRRHPYNLIAYAFPRGGSGEQERTSWQVDGGRQDQQRKLVNDRLKDFHSDKDRASGIHRYRTPVRTEVFWTDARTYEEAMVKSGLSASFPIKQVLVGLDASTSNLTNKNRRVVLGVIRQEFYRLGIAAQSDASGPSAYIINDDANVQHLRSLMGTKATVPGIPALVTSVSYGRLVLFAYERTGSEQGARSGASVSGKWKGVGGSLDLDDEQFRQSSSEAVRIFVFGGDTVPTGFGELATPDPEGATASGSQGEVPPANAATAIEALVNGLREWNGELGIPVGIEFTLLDGSTTLRPFLMSMAEMARATAPNVGWTFDAWADIKGNFDPGIAGLGDWDFKLLLQDHELLRFHRGIADGAKFWVSNLAKESVAQRTNVFPNQPAEWGQSFTGFFIDLKENDPSPNPDDRKNLAFGDSLVLERPEAYRAFEASLESAKASLADLTRLFEEVRRVERADARSEAQSAMHRSWQTALAQLRAKVEQDRPIFAKLKRDAEAAKQALVSLEQNGVSITGAHDNGNTFRIVGQPHLSGYRLYVEQTQNSIEVAFRNIENHVKRFNP